MHLYKRDSAKQVMDSKLFHSKFGQLSRRDLYKHWVYLSIQSIQSNSTQSMKVSLFDLVFSYETLQALSPQVSYNLQTLLSMLKFQLLRLDQDLHSFTHQQKNRQKFPVNYGPLSGTEYSLYLRDKMSREYTSLNRADRLFKYIDQDAWIPRNSLSIVPMKSTSFVSRNREIVGLDSYRRGSRKSLVHQSIPAQHYLLSIFYQHPKALFILDLYHRRNQKSITLKMP